MRSAKVAADALTPWYRAITVVLYLMLPSGAEAHPVLEGVAGFYGGLLHPLLVPSHILTVAAAAALSGAQVPPRPAAATTLFVLGLIGGFVVLGLAYVPQHIGELLLLVAGVSGALLAYGRSLPNLASGAISLLAGLGIALDSPPQAVSLREALVILLGTFCGAAILFGAIAECTSMLRREWQRIGLRILGSWAAASAALALAFAVAR